MDKSISKDVLSRELLSLKGISCITWNKDFSRKYNNYKIRVRTVQKRLGYLYLRSKR